MGFFSVFVCVDKFCIYAKIQMNQNPMIQNLL